MNLKEITLLILGLIALCAFGFAMKCVEYKIVASFLS